MKKYALLFMALHFSIADYGQNAFKAFVKDAKTHQTLIGATVSLANTAIGVVADTAGFIDLEHIPSGRQAFQTSYLGYQPRLDTFTLPMADTAIILLDP